MKRAFALLLLAALLTTNTSMTSAHAEINSSGISGFQGWKSARVEEARKNLDKLQADLQAPMKAPPSKFGRGDQKLQQAQFNVEIAQELTISDYFTLYVSQLKDRSSFLDAAKKLTAEETADLMMAYQKQLSAGSQVSESSLPLLAAPSSQAKPTRLRD